jgi:hypothetical protein
VAQKAGQPTIDDPITLAATTNWQDVPFVFNGGVAALRIRDCITLPGAIAVYHTVVGD